MSERKYRQHGYQDDDRDRSRPPDRERRPAPTPGAPAATRRLSSEGARNPNLMGFHEVVKCARCGAPTSSSTISGRGVADRSPATARANVSGSAIGGAMRAAYAALAVPRVTARRVIDG